MKRAWWSIVAVTVASGALAAQALAVPPTRTEQSARFVVADPAACGSYGVAWNIDLHVVGTTHFDDEGRRVRLVQRITEDNTVTNTVTGFTLRDGPVNFTQTTTFDPATGARELVEISGTSVNVRRDDGEMLVDRGRIVIDGQTGEILFSAGPHPVREAMDGSFDIRRALPAFCEILR